MTEKIVIENNSDNLTEGFFRNSAGVEIFYRIWETIETPKAHVVFVHGHGEHVTRCLNVFKQFSESGIKVLAFDQAGCGETGRRANNIGGAMGLEQVVQDISLAIECIHQPDVPLFLMGHSFGGCAILNYLAHGSKREILLGAIASAPCIEVAKVALPPRVVQVVLKFLAAVFPRLKVSVKIDVSALSRKKSEVDLYVKDPLVFSKSALIQLRDCLMGGKNLMKEGYKNICIPKLLLAHGTADSVTSHDATVSLAEKIRALSNVPELEMRSYEGFYHEMHFDLDCDQVISKYIDWIKSHLVGSTVPENSVDPLQ